MDLPSNSGGTSAVNASSGKEEGLIGVKNTKNSLQVVLDQWRGNQISTSKKKNVDYSQFCKIFVTAIEMK
jgi:hypothetical protein